MVSACYLEFEIRGIDLTDVSTIVLLKQNTKLEDKKPEINARRWVLCTLLQNAKNFYLFHSFVWRLNA